MCNKLGDLNNFHHVIWLLEVLATGLRVAHLNSWEVKIADDWVMGRDSDLINVE